MDAYSQAGRLVRLSNNSELFVRAPVTPHRSMSAVENPDDAGLLRQMRNGDAEAFTALYRRHQGAVYRFALQMTGRRAVAEDVTQEVFMALIRNPESYDAARGALASYLYGAARNTVHRILERDRFCAAEGEQETAAPDNALADLTRQETLVEVRRAVLALPANYREVVVLCDLHEMSYQDAAEVMGCAVGTVRSRLNRARNLLAAKLERSGANPARCLA